jgi:hypothetical protein
MNQTIHEITTRILFAQRTRNIKTINRHISVITKRDQRTKKDNIRNWMSRNIVRDYIKNDSSGLASKLMSAVYGNSRDCDATRLESFIIQKNEVYDICSSDIQVIQQSVNTTIEFLVSKNIAVSSHFSVIAGAMLIQLVLSGARGSARGFGCGNNIIQSIKEEKGREKTLIQQQKNHAPIVQQKQPVATEIADSWEDNDEPFVFEKPAEVESWEDL